MKILLAAGAALACCTAFAQAPASAPATGASQPATNGNGTMSSSTGSASFCLFALPADNGGQRFINLGIVQYVDVHADSVQIGYGGGNFGSGHEAKIPVKSHDEAVAMVGKLRQTAEDCARRPIPNLILKEDRK
jgi:hypothetical protein